MVWDVTDPPSSDILNARLRAKFYEAMYIVNRPFLNYALHRMSSEITLEMLAKIKDYQNNHKITSKLEIELIRNEIEVYYACVDCITAAREIILAFNGLIFRNNVPTNRPIVGNIFGIAHR